jgi:hypothetical protein
VEKRPIPRQNNAFKPESTLSNSEQYLGFICRNLPRKSVATAEVPQHGTTVGAFLSSIALAKEDSQRGLPREAEGLLRGIFTWD